MQFLMPLLGGLLSIASSMVGRVLIALGISYATFKGFDVTIGWILNTIKGSFGGMPAQAVSFLSWLWIDRAITTIFSAYTAAASIKMMSGSMTKMIHKGPGQ